MTKIIRVTFNKTKILQDLIDVKESIHIRVVYKKETLTRCQHESYQAHTSGRSPNRTGQLSERLRGRYILKTLQGLLFNHKKVSGGGTSFITPDFSLDLPSHQTAPHMCGNVNHLHLSSKVNGFHLMHFTCMAHGIP